MDTVSRHGGDEFLIILAEMVRPADAALVAAKVNAALGAYSRIDDHGVSLKASIGISVYPEDGDDAKTLIDRADAAMYLAKKKPIGGFVFHAAHPPERASLPAPAMQPQRRRLTHHEVKMAEHERRNQQLLEANEKLVLATLGAHELLAAAEEAQRQQAALLSRLVERFERPGRGP
jgi:GGDEF domain-containing protein